MFQAMKILVVDDDEQIIRLIRPALMQQNYTVEVAMDGQTGFDLLTNVPCGLVLLDMMLPRLNGIQFCQRLRAQGNETPVLMMTARDASTDKVLGLDAGADDYIVKPIDIDELIARVRALLRRGTTNTPILEWGRLQFNPSTQAVSYAGKPLNFRPKELAIMELLLRQKQRVLSRQMILDHLWVLEDCPDDNTIKAHIRGIRRVLESVGAGNLIETLYGKGYRLNPAFLEQSVSPDRSASSIVEPVAFSAQLTSETIAETWQQVQHLTWQRLQDLEDAVQTLKSQPSNQAARQQAEAVSHQLAGTLGSYGFEVGSGLAKQLEQYLQQYDNQDAISSTLDQSNYPDHPDKNMGSIDPAQLEQWVLALYQAICPASKNVAAPAPTEREAKTMSAIQPAQPLILVVSHDRNWVDQLAQAEASNAFQLQVCSPNHLSRVLQGQQPHAILLDLTEQRSGEDLNFFQDLLQSYQSHLPVLLVVDPASYPIDDSETSLTIARLDAKARLQKTWQPAIIIKIISDFIPSNIKVLAITSDREWNRVMSQLFAAHQIQFTDLDRCEELLNWLDQVRPDVLILDNQDSNPSTICRLIRTDPRWLWLPIFLLDRSEGQRLPQPLLAGVDGYLRDDRPLSEWILMIWHAIHRVRALKRVAKDELLLAIP